MKLKFRSSRFAAVVLAVAAACLLTFSVPMAARAQGDDSNQYVLSKATYDQVTRIQKFLGNEEYSKVVSAGKALLPKVESDYAKALVSELIANAYLLSKNYDAAEVYLERIVKLNALQPRSQRSVIYQLATVYLSQSKYQQSIRLYKQVLDQAKADKKMPDPALYYRLGLAYSFAGEYDNAYNYIEEAIHKRETQPVKKGEKREPVPKDWYQNLFIVVYKQKNYDKANDIAKMLVAKWPGDKDFWNYYANTFLLLKEDRAATNVYALMNKRGLLKDKDDYMQLVSLYTEQKAPYKAATLLASVMDQGIVPKTADNYDLLAGLWMQAREWDKALAALGKEAALAPNGSIYLRQASIYLSKRNYDKAVAAARQALQKGGLEDTGQAWMILGQAAFRANDTGTALNAFRKAENYRSQRENAQGWIKFVLSSRKENGGGGR